MLLLSVALAAPVVAPGINSSRVVPGQSVSTMEVAEKLSGVKVIRVGDIDGPKGELFVNSAVAALNRERQGQYRTAADLGASAVGGLGQAAAAATGIVAAGSGVVGAGVIADKAEGAVEGGSEKAAARLDGIDRHPDEGFGILRDGPSAADRIRGGAEKVIAHQGAVDKAAKVAGAAGAGQVQTALSVGKDAAKVTAAFFRAGVAGNSPPYVGVHLPIEAVKEGKSDAVLSAHINLDKVEDTEYTKEEKRKKRDKDGNVVYDEEGNVVWIVVEIPCIQRKVEIDIRSRLALPAGSVVTTFRHQAEEVDDACGPKRMKKIKTPEELASVHISSAGSVWGRLIQPQMDTIRLKLNPSGTTALAVDHVLHNRHAAGMCLFQDALSHNKADAHARYNQAVVLEAWGLYDDALSLYTEAETDSAFSKGRWDNGARRVKKRLAELERLETAYGMVPNPVAFPYAETCPAIDRTDRVAVTKRAMLKTSRTGDDIRKLYEGELLRIVTEEGKWAEVEQLDGSTGWVKAKRAFK